MRVPSTWMLLLVAVVGFAGCGDDDDGGELNPGPSAAGPCPQVEDLFTFVKDHDVRLETALRDYDLKQALRKRLERISTAAGASGSDIAAVLAPALETANDVAVRADAIRAVRAICSRS